MNRPFRGENSDRKQLKETALRFYEGGFFDIFLKDNLHPGGLGMTEELGVLAGINRDSVVLDVGSGRGVSAIFLAKKFGCKVFGIDLSEVMIEKATNLAEVEKVSDRVAFKRGDAEKLLFETGMFTTVISECALCLFPTKNSALSEMYRVLKGGGRIAVSDVTSEQLPKGLQNRLSFVSCIAGAESLEALRLLFEGAGFCEVTTIDRSQVIVELYESLKSRKASLKLLLKIVADSCGCVDLKDVEEVGRTVEQLILEGRLGYGILVGRKPVDPRCLA